MAGYWRREPEKVRPQELTLAEALMGLSVEVIGRLGGGLNHHYPCFSPGTGGLLTSEKHRIDLAPSTHHPPGTLIHQLWNFIVIFHIINALVYFQYV